MNQTIAPKRSSMAARIAGGSIAIGVLALVWYLDRDRLFDRPWLAPLLLVVFGTIAAGEITSLLRLRRYAGRGVLLRALCAAYLVGRWLVLARGGDATNFAEWGLLAAVVAFTLAELRRGEPEVGVPRAALQLFGFVWIVLFGMLLDVMLVPTQPNGIALALFLLFTSKCNDIGGYLLGSVVGGPKLAPRISPGKTISGSIGGLALATAFACVVGRMLEPAPPVGQLLVFAVVVSAVTQIADLGESLFKRYCGAKDSSRLVPTFGGALDMIDSLVLAAPAGWLLIDAFGWSRS